MLGPQYSFNENQSNFGASPLFKLKGKISLFVESENMAYQDSKEFMEYVNLSQPTTFLKLMPIGEFSSIASLDDLIDYNKTNITIVTPNPTESNPNNITIQAVQYAGCQIVSLMFWKKDSYLDNAIMFFNKYQSAFVLKPEELRYKENLIPDAIPQKKSNSYAPRDLDTGVANIKFNI